MAEASLSNLIKALQIFLKYGDPNQPTHCEHDELFVLVNPDKVSGEDKAKLDDLGFIVDEEGYFISFSYGRA